MNLSETRLRKLHCDSCVDSDGTFNRESVQVRYGKENNSRSLPYKVGSLPYSLVTELTEECF